MIIKNNSLSASALKCYIACPFKFFIQYVLKIKQPQTWATSNGSLIHAVIENYSKGHTKNWQREMFWRYKHVKPWQYHKQYLTHSADCWGCQFLESIDHYHGDFFKDVPLLPLKGKLEEDCPLIELVEGRNLVQKVLDRVPSPFEGKVIGVEKKFDVELEKGININGIIDLIIEKDPETIEIRDWKTGNWIPTYGDCVEDPQLRIYDIAVSILYPQHKVRLLTFDYIKKKEYTFVISDEERAFNKNWLISKIKEIQYNYDPQRIKTFLGCEKMCLGLKKCETIWKDRVVTIAKLREENKF